MMTQRNDIHRPIEMDPENYEYLFAADTGPGGLVGLMSTDQGREMWQGLIRNLDPATADRGTSQCHHCGARIRYVAFLRHIPTGHNIVVGETCLDNRFSLVSKAEFDRLRKAAALDRAKQRIKTAATEYVTDLKATDDEMAQLLGHAMDRDTDLTDLVKPGWAFDTFTDIRRKVWNQYGAPTTRQQDLLIRLLSERKAYDVEMANRAPEAPKVPAPTGRVDFEGKVVFRKAYDSEFGTTWKIIVVVTEAEGEWSVFVTEPSSIATSKGDIVRMRATLKPGRSASEAKGSRPSNAQIVEEAGEELPSSLD